MAELERARRRRGPRARMDGARAQCGARSGLDRGRHRVGALAAGLAGDRAARCVPVEGAGGRHRRARARADRGAARASSRRRSAMRAPATAPRRAAAGRGPGVATARRRASRRSSRWRRCRTIPAPSRNSTPRATTGRAGNEFVSFSGDAGRRPVTGRPAPCVPPCVVRDCSRPSCSCGLARGSTIQAACELLQAAVAQLVEHLIRNEGVGGSSPFRGTNDLAGIRSLRKITGVTHSGAFVLPPALRSGQRWRACRRRHMLPHVEMGRPMRDARRHITNDGVRGMDDDFHCRAHDR